MCVLCVTEARVYTGLRRPVSMITNRSLPSPLSDYNNIIRVRMMAPRTNSNIMASIYDDRWECAENCSQTTNVGGLFILMQRILIIF